MNSFHQSLAYQSFEAAINGVARLARTQGFRIHQRKGPQKNSYELHGIVSFGCTAPGCSWFVTLKRLPLDGPSTSTAPAEQWVVYTLHDSHKSTCKPARSRRRRPSISSISSLETENTEDELPPELLRPYERSPSLPILMHARGSRIEAVTEQARPVEVPHSDAPQSVPTGFPELAHSDPPDPVALHKYIQDLLASLETQPVQSEPNSTTIDTRALLASLTEPLPVPLDFPFSNSDLQNSYQETDYPFQGNQQPFSEALLNGTEFLQGSSKDLSSELERLPERLQRAASMLQTIDPETINPSNLLTSANINGYHAHTMPTSAFLETHNPVEVEKPISQPYQEYAAPISTDDWSGSDDGIEDEEQDLSRSFLHHHLDDTGDQQNYHSDMWTQQETNGQEYNGTANDGTEDEAHNQEDPNGDMSSSSDSDIPAEVLVNINASRSNRSSSRSESVDKDVRSSKAAYQTDFNHDEPYQPDHEPYGAVPALTTRNAPPEAVPTTRIPKSSHHPRKPTFTVPDEPEETFDVYKIFYSFEEAEAAILANAQKNGVPLKIRYRPNLLDDGINARRQACLECMRLCGYRIYLKDDHRSQWRVINMEGGHKPSCYQGKARTRVKRGTNPFHTLRNKEKDSMNVTVTVWEPAGGSKRKRRASSMSSDRSSSPSILVVTHSDAVMKSVRSVGPGFTPPREQWYPSPSPVPFKKSKGKGKGKGKAHAKKNGRSPDKAIQVDDSAEHDYDPPYYGAGVEDDYLPPPLRNEDNHANGANDSPRQDDSVQNNNQYARKKLPTTQQLLYGSSRPDIKARHKIPTKPLGRSPAKNRERLERRQGGGDTSRPYSLTPARPARRKFAYAAQNERLPGESSANDDDEDMFLHSGRFSQRMLSDLRSSRALRSSRRSHGTGRPHVEQASMVSSTNGRLRRADDPDFMPSASDALKSGSQSARGRGRPRLRGEKGITSNISLKMSLPQAGFSDKEVRFLHKGGYSSVKDLTREGLACTLEDFSMFKSWLDDLTVPDAVANEAYSTRQAVRQRVKSIAEEVRVRSTIVWEAAGMMEEGSDVGEDDGTTMHDSQYSMTAARQSEPNRALRSEDEAVSVPDRSDRMQAKTNSVPSRNGHYNGYTHGSGLSDSSDIEFLGVGLRAG